MIAFHESIPAFVSVESMLDLQTRNHKVNQIQKEKKGEIIIRFTTDSIFTLRNKAFLHSSRRNIEVHKEVYDHEQEDMKNIFYYQQKIELTHLR